MSEVDEIKSNAFLIYSEFGPDLRIPRPQRLAECFPETPALTIQSWLKEFESIEAYIWKTAELGGHKKMSVQEFNEQTKELFSFMNSDALQEAWNRVNYYVWHEGY